jgi:hypothetical protein
LLHGISPDSRPGAARVRAGRSRLVRESVEGDEGVAAGS